MKENIEGFNGRELSLAPASHHRRIATAFLWVSAFVLIGKLAGAAKEMTIAWRYGVSETVDAYVFVFNLVSWPVSVWFSVLTVVLLPLVANVRVRNPRALPRFRAELLGLTLLVGVGLGILAYFGFAALLRAGWTGLAGPALEEALAMVGPLSILLPLGIVINQFSAWMMACGRHRNTLLEVLPALAILVALLLPPGWIPEPLIWGTVAGFALQLAGLGLPLWYMDELQRPALGFRSPAWQGFWGSIGIMAVGQALMSITGLIDQFFAAHLGAGSIATLSYASRIMALILGLGATAINRATLPIFSEVAATGDVAGVRGLTLHWARMMFLLGLAAAVALWLVAPWIVALLFQRGAFAPSNTADVTEVLRAFLLQTPVYFLGLVLVAALSSRKKYSVLLITGLLALIVKPMGNAILIQFFGLSGIAASTSVVYIVTSSYMFMKIRKS